MPAPRIFAHPERPSHEMQQGMGMSVEKRRTVIAWVSGVVVGLLWIAMALTCIVSGVRGYANDRGDWGLAWTLIGTLLLVAGLAAIIGTWWHQRRVLPRAESH